uniref:Uncharacterized protein n=1 Tax=Panagrolaimus superbus TaxID=310955 RepID=A0A914Y1S3_9BILA
MTSILQRLQILKPTFQAAFSTSSVNLNAYRASLGKIRRRKYIKEYETLIMHSDGSIVPARTKEPRHFIQFPANLSNLSEDERRQRLAARKPKTKKIKQEVIDDNFDLNQYTSMFNNKRKTS